MYLVGCFEKGTLLLEPVTDLGFRVNSSRFTLLGFRGIDRV